MNDQYAACPYCGLQISNEASRCLYCGRELPTSEENDKRYGTQYPKKSIETRQYIFWVLLGYTVAAAVIILGALFILRPIETNTVRSLDPGQITLAFALAGCLFGVLLVPAFGIIGGRMGLSLGKSNGSAGAGAGLGGFIYGGLVLSFTVINILLTN